MNVRQRTTLICLLVASLLLSACDPWAMFRPAPKPPATAGSNDLVGTRWRIVYDAPQSGHREYDLIFHENGRFENTHPNDTTPDNDTWEIVDAKLILRFNDGYAIYEGVFSDGDSVAGTATNETGASWEWSAQRQ